MIHLCLGNCGTDTLRGKGAGKVRNIWVIFTVLDPETLNETVGNFFVYILEQRAALLEEKKFLLTDFSVTSFYIIPQNMVNFYWTTILSC